MHAALPVLATDRRALALLLLAGLALVVAAMALAGPAAGGVGVGDDLLVAPFRWDPQSGPVAA